MNDIWRSGSPTNERFHNAIGARRHSRIDRLCCLEKEPARRFQAVSDLRDALAPSPLQPRRKPTASTRSMVRRSGVFWTAIAAVWVLGIGVTVLVALERLR